MKASFLLLGVLLGGCAHSIAQTRAEGPPRTSVQLADYDRALACIGSNVAGRYGLTFAPTDRGGAFHFTQGATFGGVSSILVDVERAPATARVYFTGGPWLGRDEAIVRAVEACAAAAPA